jgi:cell division septation protein DedD
VLLAVVAPCRLAAQDLPAIRTALQLAAEGRSDSARKLVEAELRRSHPGDDAYVEALYFRARLATYGDSAERDLRRVAIEFSTSRWADDALLQLAQLAMAAGNPASALTLAERLRRDYPGSELRARAGFWAGRAGFDVGEPRAACALLDSAQAEAAGDVEFANQVAFYQARCSGLAPAPPAESARAAPAPAPADSAAVAAPRARPFEVQVSAARSDQAARRVADRLTRAGYPTRIVASADGIRRIRVGPYETIEAAEAAAGDLRRLVGGTPFVVRTP